MKFVFRVICQFSYHLSGFLFKKNNTFWWTFIGMYVIFLTFEIIVEISEMNLDNCYSLEY